MRRVRGGGGGGGGGGGWGYYRNKNTRCGKRRYTKRLISSYVFLTSQSFVIKIQFSFTNWSDVTFTCNFVWTPRHECLEFSLGIESSYVDLVCQLLFLYSKKKQKCVFCFCLCLFVFILLFYFSFKTNPRWPPSLNHDVMSTSREVITSRSGPQKGKQCSPSKLQCQSFIALGVMKKEVGGRGGVGNPLNPRP